METTEIDLMVSKNQLSFDFDGLEETPITKNLIKSVNHSYIADEVLFVVARVKGGEICPHFENLLLSGKTMLEWVSLAGRDCEQIVIEEGDEIAKLKNIQTDKPIIALFYSDTPLLDKNSFYEIIDYFSQRGMNYLRLSRGLIIKTSYLSRVCGDLVGDVAYECKNLFRIDEGGKINVVNSILQEKILSYHAKNGVIMLGPNIYIEADCEIGKGVVIYPNNTILGQTVIESGAILESGNVVKDCILLNKAILKGCYCEKSKISSVQEPFSKIINQKV